MPGNALAKAMLNTAKSDAKAHGNMLDSESFDDRVFGFHAQQAVEKALKAWLIVSNHSHPFTHDLSFLLHELEQAGADVERYWDMLDLTSYAVRFRYEAMPIDEEPLDRAVLLEDVRSLIKHVSGLIA